MDRYKIKDLTERINKEKTTELKNKMLFMWIKQDVINLKEYNELVKSLLFGVGVELPNIYAGGLNSKRIKEIDTIAETYTCDSSTIRRVFCDGADWYKKQLKDSGN